MRDAQVAASLLKWNGFVRGVISSMKPYQRKKLSDVLETGPIPERYYLSAKACAGILRRAEKRGKELPRPLKVALEEVARTISPQAVDSSVQPTSLGLSAQEPRAGAGSEPTSILGGGIVPETAMCLNAKGGGGRIDGESETFIASPLSAGYGKRQYAPEDNFIGTFQNTGQGWWNDEPIAQTIRDASAGGASHANVIAHSLRADGFDASEDGTGRGTPLIAETLRSHPRPGSNSLGAVILPFDTTQITSKANGNNPKAGDPCHPLVRGAHPPAIAFSAKDHGGDAGEISPTLRAMEHDGSHANGGGQVAVAQTITADMYRSGRAVAGNNDQGVRNCVVSTMAVRRLTPKECERLQGFRDGYTAITYNGKPAADGPRYKALGNSMAVPVLEWIGQRIISAFTERPDNTEVQNNRGVAKEEETISRPQSIEAKPTRGVASK